MWYPPVALHVRYVINGTASVPDIGPRGLWQEATGEPIGLALVIATLLGLVVFAAVVPRFPGFGRFRVALDAALHDYVEYLPWMLRLSAGIVLLGAGVQGYAFSNHLDVATRTPFTFLLMAAGFFLLLGVAVRLWAVLAIIAWSWALSFHGPDVFMAAEVVAALVTLTAISAGRPSVDDILARTLGAAPRALRPAARLKWLFGPDPDADVAKAIHSWVPVVLRVGLGVSLGYAGFVEKLLDPGPAMVVAERYGLAFGPVSAATVVLTAGLVEVFLGLALIVGLGTRAFAGLAFFVLTVTLFALPDDPVVGHVALWGVASAVFILGSGPWSVDRWAGRAAHDEG